MPYSSCSTRLQAACSSEELLHYVHRDTSEFLNSRWLPGAPRSENRCRGCSYVAK